MITGKTKLYGIVGHPIEHVRVPATFNERFLRQSIDAVSLPIHVLPERLGAAIGGLRALENLVGFVVTAPHKKAMVAMCDEVLGEARLVGAVNTVRREPDGRLVGELFDGVGFVKGLTDLGQSPAGKRVFMMGAGGAGNAVGFALARAGASALTIRNRTPERAEDLARRIGAAYPACKVQAGSGDPAEHDIAINATSCGLKADDPLPFQVDHLKGTLVAEVIMKPQRTALLTRAAERGLPTHEGRYMLDYQMDLMFDFFGSSSNPSRESARKEI